MTDQPDDHPSYLQRLAAIADEIAALKTRCANIEELDQLDALLAKIGELQLRIAVAAADRAETDAMENRFGPRIRTSLED